MKKYYFLFTFIFLIFIFIFFYFFQYWTLPFLVFAIGYYIYFFKKYTIWLLLIIFLTLIFNYKGDDDINDNYEHYAVVKEVYTTSITVVENKNKYYLMKVDEDLIINDVIYFEGYYYEDDFEKGSFEVFFNSTKSIAYSYPKNIKLVERPTSFRNKLYSNLVEDDCFYSDFSLFMLYGKINNRNEYISETVTDMGISYLFVISGFHIALFYMLINKLFLSLKINENLINYFSIFVSTIFLFLVFFPKTGVRALMTIALIKMSNLKSIECLSLVGIIFFIFNPWSMFGASMVLSFSITMMIYLYNFGNNYFLDYLNISIIALYISLPTICTWETEHNLLAPFLSTIITPLISIYYIISIIFLPFHNLWFIASLLFELLWIIIYLLSWIELTIDIEIIGFFNQWFLITISLLYVYIQRENKIILLTSFLFITPFIYFI